MSKKEIKEHSKKEKELKKSLNSSKMQRTQSMRLNIDHNQEIKKHKTKFLTQQTKIVEKIQSFYTLHFYQESKELDEFIKENLEYFFSVLQELDKYLEHIYSLKLKIDEMIAISILKLIYYGYFYESQTKISSKPLFNQYLRDCLAVETEKRIREDEKRVRKVKRSEKI